MQEVLYAAACEPYFMAREIEIVDFNFETRKIRAKLKGENFESGKHGGEGKSPILSTKQSVDVQIIETLKRYWSEGDNVFCYEDWRDGRKV